MRALDRPTDRPPGLAGLDVEFRYCDAAGLADPVDGARALMLWDYFSKAVHDVWPRTGSLEWIHVTAAGVDTLLFDELRDSDVVGTNARGLFDRPIAEYVLAQAHIWRARTPCGDLEQEIPCPSPPDGVQAHWMGYIPGGAA